MSYIEVQLSDIETANRLAHEVLGRTLDELPAQTRKLLKLIQSMVQGEFEKQSIEQKDYRFSRREIREFTGWGNTQLKVHLGRLEEMEYLLAHRGSRGQSYSYELLYNVQDSSDQPRLMGLIDTENLQCDEKKSGLKANKSALGRPQVGGWSEEEKHAEPFSHKAQSESELKSVKSAIAAKNNGASHRSSVVA